MVQHNINKVEYKLSELIHRFGGRLQGDDVSVYGIAPTDFAKPGDITFLTDRKYKQALIDSSASAVIVSAEGLALTNKPAIVSDNPYLYFSQVSDLFYPRSTLDNEIKVTSKIDSTTVIAANPAIADYVVIGKNCKIGANCQIHSHVVIADNVVIGDNVILYPHVTLYSNVTMGHNCIIHSGTVIGSDGFGYAADKQRNWYRIPQIGGVVIGNKVEIGANTTIDSGTLMPTIIEDGVIIDNLVQIAHNVHIGAYTAIAGTVGIAGGTKIGKYCQLGGGCGLNGHIELADNVIISGKTVVNQSIMTPGVYAAYYPAMSYKEWARSAVHLKNLDALSKRVKKLEDKLVIPNS